MKKKLLSLLLALMLLVGLLPLPTKAAEPSAEDVTVISSPEELANLGGQSLTGNYRLGADIDMSGVSMSPISSLRNGIFDGAGHTITNLSMDVSWGNCGLFGELGSSATLKDLTLSNANISSTVASSSYGTGGLVGKVSGTSTIEGCGISGTVSCKLTSAYYQSYIGGLVGYLNGSCTISNCYSQADVVNEAKATGSVTGGFLGKTSNCYTAGDVKVTGYSSNPYGFAYSYASAGFTFTNCYYDSERNPNGFNQSWDIIPVGKTTTELKELASVLGPEFQPDRDGAASLNNGYPILNWQYVDPTAEHTVAFTVTPPPKKEVTALWITNMY